MANVIQLRKFYSEALDEVYKLASLTSVLDGDNTLVKREQMQTSCSFLRCPWMDLRTTEETAGM